MGKNPLRKKQAPMQIVYTGIPMERIAAYIMGELPETENGNKYILVVSDYFTKWTECFAMPNMEARTVVKIIVEEVIVRFGAPYFIHSDRGRQFESNLFKDMCILLGIEKTQTTPYHRKSDGMVERFNRTLEAMLSAYVSDHQRDWDSHLPYVMMAYRSAEHERTTLTPNMLMLGRETSTPLYLMYEMPSSIKMKPANMWVWELRERLEDAHRIVRKYALGSMFRQKTYHDRKSYWEKFQVGDIVYVFFPKHKICCFPKFTSFWRGPFTVQRIITDVLYEVDGG
jgi:hypothetical protein